MAPEGPEGVELPAWGLHPRDLPAQPSALRSEGRRRTTLAQISRVLDEQSKPDEQRLAKLAVLLYTLTRVVANLYVLSFKPTLASSFLRAGLAAPSRSLSTWKLDSVLRPVVTGLGLYIYLHRKARLSENSSLHSWSARLLFCLASFHCDVWLLSLLPLPTLSKEVPFTRLYHLETFVVLWEVFCNVAQMHMSNLKLRALGWHLTAQRCQTLLAISSVLVVALVAFDYWLTAIMSNYLLHLPDDGAWVMYLKYNWWIALSFVLAAVLAQFWGFTSAATTAFLLPAPETNLRPTAYCLCADGILLLLRPLVSCYAVENVFVDVRAVTADCGFQVLNVLLLSGLVGPQQLALSMESFRKLADLSGFGLAAKRIAFPGHVNPRAIDCIVSFPGKYSTLWDDAVSIATSQDTCSLACVFLTDSISGLGQHSENPDSPGLCWCHAIYGHLPADTYLSVVELPEKEHDTPASQQARQQLLAFKRADAEAMGQVLVIRRDQGELHWRKELSEALRLAEARSLQQQGRAPWGCRWFEEWRKNVHKAVDLGQTLHVFYFEGRRGQGKIAWEQLCNDQVKERVRPNSGLGASQTAEVAYLEMMGLSYEEHDIKDFKEVVAAGKTRAGWGSGFPQPRDRPQRFHYLL